MFSSAKVNKKSEPTKSSLLNYVKCTYDNLDRSVKTVIDAGA